MGQLPLPASPSWPPSATLREESSLAEAKLDRSSKHLDLRETVRRDFSPTHTGCEYRPRGRSSIAADSQQPKKAGLSAGLEKILSSS
jgi:hypothetical protein